MKTNQNLIRKMGDFDVIQRTSDGMFDATSLLKQWNAYSGQQKKLDHYFENNSTKEFITALMSEENLNTRNSVYLKTRGKKGKTMMCPLLFIDYSMWLNPAFKIKVLKFISDELLKYRNEAGDAYIKMTAAIASIVPKKNLPLSIKKVARALNYIVYNSHERELRNKQAEENKARELAELEKDVAKLINQDFIKSFSSLVNYLRRLWREKYMPKELRT
jgi:hypothetical protein